MMIKMNAVINPQDGIVATMMTGSPCMQGITIGGCTRAGEDAVNAVSYLILDAERAVGLTGEDVVVRIHPKNPPEFVRRACQVARDLGGKLKFVSDTQTIRSLVWTGGSTRRMPTNIFPPAVTTRRSRPRPTTSAAPALTIP